MHKIRKWMKVIALIYISFSVIVAIINTRIIVNRLQPHEIFYMGYTLALMQQMLDFRVTNFKVALFFYFVFTVLKFTLVEATNDVQPILVVFLEIFPIILGFQSEQAERRLFDSLYKSKSQLLKFKQLLTEYLPNQIVILSKDVENDQFINNAFKKSFQCKDQSQLEASLKTLIFSNEDAEKNKRALLSTNYTDHDNGKILDLSSFMNLALSKIEMVKQLQCISFEVFEDRKLYIKPALAKEPQKQSDNAKNTLKKKKFMFNFRKSSESSKENSPKKENFTVQTTLYKARETTESFREPLPLKATQKNFSERELR